jgi:hypothetical protein
MDKEYLTKEDANKMYLKIQKKERGFSDFYTDDWPPFLLKKDATDAYEKFVAKKELERIFLGKNILQRHRLNQFLVGVGVASVFALLDFYKIGVATILVTAILVLLQNLKETREDFREHRCDC